MVTKGEHAERRYIESLELRYDVYVNRAGWLRWFPTGTPPEPDLALVERDVAWGVRLPEWRKDIKLSQLRAQ